MAKAKKTNKKTESKNKQAIDLRWLYVGILLIGLGLMFGGVEIIKSFSATTPQTKVSALNSTTAPPTTEPLVDGEPSRIVIKSVGIDLAVLPGYYNANAQSWTLSLNNAHWGVMTAKANNKQGLTYIYAHYRKHVFYTLPKIQPGDTAEVYTQNGHVFTYKFSSSLTTSPTDTSLFDYKGKPILVLQTCSGVWYEKRQLFTFDYVSYK